MDKIDFVLIWVDDSDPEWQKSYSKYSKELRGDKRVARFRDWGTLKYWFRGVEKFAPWVNKIHFVTCGHVPSWLNLEHEKLHFVTHSDYIPEQYLPTFNSCCIELNLHRIKGLSEHFVYFNDDTFIINKIKPSRFFKNGIPCDMAVLNAIQPTSDMNDHILINNIAFINSKFNKRKAIKANFFKWLNLSYKQNLLRTLALFPYPTFTGFIDPHLPNPFNKEILNKCWELNEKLLDETCKSKFRERTNINQYIFRYYQLVTGNFKPINPFDTSKTYSSINDEIFNAAINDLTHQIKPLICINDGEVSDFEDAKKRLISAFESILPEKSTFEI